MNLVRLVQTVAPLVSGGAMTKLDEVRTGAVLTFAVAASGTVAAVFVLVAITIAIAAEVGPIFACLIMGGVFAILSIALFLKRRARINRKRREAKQQAAIAAAAAGGKTVGGGLSGPLMALAAGYALARKG